MRICLQDGEHNDWWITFPTGCVPMVGDTIIESCSPEGAEVYYKVTERIWNVISKEEGDDKGELYYINVEKTVSYGGKDEK